MATAFFKGIFENKLLQDDRETIFEFTIEGLDGVFAVFAPVGELYSQLAVLVLLQIPIQCAFAMVVYAFIVQRRGTPGAYLLGWGVIIPLSCCVPYALLRFFDVRNKVIKLAAFNTPSIVVFRTIEAMMDTAPTKVVETSIQNYMAYYTTMVPFRWNKESEQRCKVTAAEVAPFFFWIVVMFHALSLLLSILIHCNFKLFEDDSVELDSFSFTVDLFRPSHLANAYLHALLTFFTLYVGFHLVALGQNMQGFSIIPVFRNPLFASRTPTEFWTQRWNTMVHYALKHGIFLPAKTIFSTKVSIIIAFLVSGVYHEMAWSVVFYQPEELINQNENEPFVPVRGKLTAFFLYTGIIMLLERPLEKRQPFIWMSKHLPTFVLSTLLVIVHLPFAHWYYGDWIVGGYFYDFRLGLWHIRKI